MSILCRRQSEATDVLHSLLVAHTVRRRAGVLCMHVVLWRGSKAAVVELYAERGAEHMIDYTRVRVGIFFISSRQDAVSTVWGKGSLGCDVLPGSSIRLYSAYRCVYISIEQVALASWFPRQ